MKSPGRKPTKTQRRRAPQGPWTPKPKVGKDIPRTASGKPIRPPKVNPKADGLGERPRKGPVEAAVSAPRAGRGNAEVGKRPDKKTIKKAAPAAGPRVSPAEAAERAEKKLDAFIAKFSEENQTFIRRARAAMRNRLPAANELVYDNYNFFVIGYGPTERTSDAIFSLVASANGVGLAFLKGATLPDPGKILRGDGKLNRHIHLESAADIKRADVEALIAAAVEQSKVPLPLSGRGILLIKSVSAKQRPRQRDVS